MIRRCLHTLIFTLLLSQSYALSHAASTDPLQQLMQLTQQQQNTDATARSKRLNEFMQARDEVAAKVINLREQVLAARAANDRMQASFENQRAELQLLEQQVSDRAGDLTAVFAATRQRAGDLASRFSESLTSAEMPGRVDTMQQLATDNRRHPDIADLRTLWHAMQQEILAASQSVKFNTQLITADGHAETAEVVRLGLFTAISNGRYLRYDKAIDSFSVLRRQPDSELRQLAAEYQLSSEQSSPVTMVIDPTRGNLLNLTAQKAALGERLQQGGQVGYLILALGIIGILLAVWRWLALAVTARRIKQQLNKIDQPATDNPLGRVLASYVHKSDDIDSVAMQLEEAILRETPILTRGEALLKLLAGIAPLLGLLGTVTGMIATFQSISLFGAGDPRLMADGISQALVTTALGLLVAIPLLLAHLMVSARSNRLVMVLEEQSAGLIARSQGWRE